MAHGRKAAARTIGADALAEFLLAQDIRTVFSLAGASFTYLLRALEQRGIAVIPTRHESATVAAADGYARVTGKLGVALIIADQGVPNAIGGLTSAFYASSPVMVLAARLPLAWEEAEGEVDHDANQLVRPVTKWARNVPDASRLLEYCQAAAKRALYGRPGPVVLSFEQDILADELAGDGPAAQPLPAECKPALATSTCAALDALLAGAQRPLIVAGSEATRDGAGPALRALAERGIPVLGNGLGRGLVPEDRIRGFSWPYAQIAACKADLVLFLGARTTRRVGFGLPPRLAPDARVVQIDSSAEFLHRNRIADLAAQADIAQAASQIEALCAQGNRQWSGQWLNEALEERRTALGALAARDAGPIHPLETVAALVRHTPEDAIVIGDGADIQNWAYGLQTIHTAPGFIEHYPLGSMGIGLPMALGAAAAAREMAGEGPARPVVMLTGDGSFGFYPAELQSAAQAGLKFTVVIANDAAWGTELHGQKVVTGAAYNTALTPARYERVAQAFDLDGYHVERREDLEGAISAAMASPGTAVVNVMIDDEAGMALKRDPRVNMILFSEVTEGIRTLSQGSEAD
ncbi:thiamine pyrophosphate-binding protein [Novosphingobium sp. YJ-S2-02]|uniref:Thiamine pyrophosphate-binding protein n=1 Tax=Novosphingobium aureum TaxID=2792964 RepID=A0A931HE73_9SPHN|nr:thiamine pyrophosphate-binding protein [Novosphingobium aureum]MBH0114470.1 thiamine pyrophosphate-binding protein [Novosphingobium aureum]